jgi:hypothetical protein
MLVPHAQNGHRGQVAARGFAADCQRVGAELLPAVLHQPKRRSFTIVGTRRVGMFGCQTVFHGDNGLTRVVGDPLQQRILQVGAAQHPAAAMEMQ